MIGIPGNVQGVKGPRLVPLTAALCAVKRNRSVLWDKGAVCTRRIPHYQEKPAHHPKPKRERKGCMPKNLLIAQSGGPTSAINASLSGIIQEAMRHSEIGEIYGAVNGIEGVLDRKIIELKSQFPTQKEFELLECTPAMALGSCRFRLPALDDKPSVYDEISAIFEEYNIGYFFYIGGNDSMDTAHKLSIYFTREQRDVRVIGVPKTIDNDLPNTDHTPGFGSAAKFIATSMMEIIRDCEVYYLDSVTIVEIMGRNAGWLAAAAALPHTVGCAAPHLIYLPEAPFDPEEFLKDVRRVQAQHKAVIVAVSEGIRLADGRYVSESMQSGMVDAFGHKYLSGVGKYLERLVAERIGCKVRSVELNVLQRCAGHMLSATDITEARKLGAHAVRFALIGETGKMVVLNRVSQQPYLVRTELADMSQVANLEKTFPTQWISPEGNAVTQEAFSYLLPLIQGDVSYPTRNGMPLHFHFEKNYVKPPVRRA